jgi:large subunit ribosomal protein L35
VPKLKTNKTAARRFSATGTGKIMHSRVGKSHLRRKKPARVKRQYDGKVALDPTNKGRITKLVPYL